MVDNAHVEKFDVKKHLPLLYAPRNQVFERVIVPSQRYLAMDGRGDPNSSAFATAMQAIYSVAYPLKFASKRTLGRDYVVPPAEGLWWADDPRVFSSGERAAWRWTILSLVPDWISDDLVDEARDSARAKGIERSGDIELREISEGDSFQLLHIGAFADESPKLRELHEDIMPAAEVTFAGPHHEIYLSDPRQTAPEKLRTIIRQPVKPIDSP